MKKDQVMSAVDTIDAAFSKFLIADMDNPRTELYTEGPDNPLEDGEQPSSEYIRHLCNEAMRSGKRMGKITARICDDLDALKEAIKTLAAHVHSDEPAVTFVDPEGEECSSKHAFIRLVSAYQCDTNHEAVRRAFARGVVLGIRGE